MRDIYDILSTETERNSASAEPKIRVYHLMI